MGTRQCPFCGKAIPDRLKQCPYCREAVPEIHLSKDRDPEGRRKIRRGFLYMLLGAVIYYFAGGIGSWQLPFTIQPRVIALLSGLVFFGGLGLMLYGMYLHHRS
jgi:hypothetical protein